MVSPVTDHDLRLAFDLAPVGLIVSRERVIQCCNVALSGMFGYAHGELKGQSLKLLYPTPAEFETIGARGVPIMREMGIYSDERIMKRKDDSLFWCHVSGRAAGSPFSWTATPGTARLGMWCAWFVASRKRA